MLHGLLVALLLSAGPGDNVQLLADPTFARIAQLLAQPPADLDIVVRQGEVVVSDPIVRPIQP
jgi:hypothetical protein